MYPNSQIGRPPDQGRLCFNILERRIIWISELVEMIPIFLFYQFMRRLCACKTVKLFALRHSESEPLQRCYFSSSEECSSCVILCENQQYTLTTWAALISFLIYSTHKKYNFVCRGRGTESHAHSVGRKISMFSLCHPVISLDCVSVYPLAWYHLD